MRKRQYGEWTKIQKMLENNKIDLLTSVQKTEEREKKFDMAWNRN